MDPSETGIARQVLLGLFVLVLCAVLAVVFERIGVPPSLLVSMTVALVVVVALAGGLSGGTMRLPVFLSGGRDLPVAAVGLVIAIIVAAAGSPSPIPAMLAVAVWAVGLAPVLRRTGVPGLAGGLGHLYRNPALRVLLALVAGGAALLFAAARLDAAARLAGPLLGLGAVPAAVLVGFVAALVLVPGGVRGAVRMAVGLGLVSVLAAAGVIGANLVAGGGALGKLAAVAMPADGAALPEIFAVAALVASPHLALVAQAGASERAVREGGLWGALSALALATAGVILADATVPASDGAVLLPMARAASRLALDLAAGCLFLQAAGSALGYELRGRVDRRRRPTSRRFARLRLTLLACIAAAIWAGVAYPGLVHDGQALAAALLVGTAGPVVALAAVVHAPGRWGGLVAAIVGLATSGTLLGGWFIPAWIPAAAGLAGLAAGIVVGIVPAVLPRRRAAPVAIEDGAL